MSGGRSGVSTSTLEAVAGGAAPRRVLYAGADRPVGEYVASILSTIGYDVSLATTSADTLATITKLNPMIVLLDATLGDLDGIETCRAIRERLGRRDLVVVLVTALSERANRARAKDAGVDDYLARPIDDVELVACVETLLRAKLFQDLRDKQREILAAELARTQDQLITAERLATLGTLAAGVGHELNNIATVLMSVVDAIDESVRISELPAREDIDDLQRATEHVVLHATQLLRLGRPGADREGPVDLRQAISGALQLLRSSPRTRHVAVRAELGDEPISANVNPNRIAQVVVNLVINAADALEEVHDRERSIWVRLLRAGERAVVTVSDNGPGIPPDKHALVFEPYYTTKAPGRGTGLGLSVVSAIVRACHGVLLLESAVGVGTTMRIELPLLEAPEPPSLPTIRPTLPGVKPPI